MYGPHGKKASEVVKLLQELIRKHGDQIVVKSGGDFPEGVRGVDLEDRDDGYHHKGTFTLY